MNRSMHGNPVLPMIIRMEPRSSGNIANWNEMKESGVRVKPRSLKSDAGVNIPLGWSDFQKIERKECLPPNPRLSVIINNRTPSIRPNYPRGKSDYPKNMKEEEIC